MRGSPLLLVYSSSSLNCSLRIFSAPRIFFGSALVRWSRGPRKLTWEGVWTSASGTGVLGRATLRICGLTRCSVLTRTFPAVPGRCWAVFGVAGRCWADFEGADRWEAVFGASGAFLEDFF